MLPTPDVENKSLPTISIIIPTCNRRDSLERLLNGLEKQSYPLALVEVIVVADGCTDDTATMLQNYQSSFTLHLIEQQNQGAAVARNQGAAKSTGMLLIFLDDDVEPSPDLVEAHVHAHDQTDQVVIGYLPPALENRSDFFHTNLWTWWEEKFYTMRQIGHRYAYDDLLSGNFSLSAELFKRVGGFDLILRCREDYELGFRLLRLGAQFKFEPNALSYHHDTVTNLDRSLKRKRQEGRADVRFGSYYPNLLPKLKIACFGTPVSLLDYLLILFAFQLPILCDNIAIVFRYLLTLLEWLRMHGLWQTLNNRLHGYWYLRGIVDELKTYKNLTSFLQNGVLKTDTEETELELDLQQGLAVAEQQLNETRPMSVCLRYGHQHIGEILPRVGAERLRGDHLRPILAKELSVSLLQAIALEDATNPLAKINPNIATDSTEHMERSMQVPR